jgi:hypothetical protein
MGGDIEIKVRGPENMRLSCFYFLEEILGVLEQVILVLHIIHGIFIMLKDEISTNKIPMFLVCLLTSIYATRLWTQLHQDCHQNDAC